MKGGGAIVAVCDGGNDTLAFLAVGIVALLWLLVVRAVVRAGRSGREKRVLIALALASILAGPAVFFGFLDGFSGSGDYVAKFALALVLSGVIGAGVAAYTGFVHVGRALFVSVWGALLLPGGWLVLFVALLAVGSGCLS